MIHLEDIENLQSVINDRLAYSKDRMKKCLDHWEHFVSWGWHDKLWIAYSKEYGQLQAEWMYWMDVKINTRKLI
jgi:hypothetical protein